MKKKLRKITVQGGLFWWAADWFYHPDQSRILRVHIWGEDKQGQPLYANLTSKWIEYPVSQAYPKPRDISVIIGYALAHRWKPYTRGGIYWLKESDQVGLEDLLLTDVGRVSEAPGPLRRKQIWKPPEAF